MKFASKANRKKSSEKFLAIFCFKPTFGNCWIDTAGRMSLGERIFAANKENL
jgi:hypothetical protein